MSARVRNGARPVVGRRNATAMSAQRPFLHRPQLREVHLHHFRVVRNAFALIADVFPSFAALFHRTATFFAARTAFLRRPQLLGVSRNGFALHRNAFALQTTVFAPLAVQNSSPQPVLLARMLRRGPILAPA